jgi:DNA-binding MarR family transcriptional regulator
MAGRDLMRLLAVADLLTKGPLARATTRQVAVFCVCYSQPEPLSVRGLAQELHMPRHTVSTALQRLENSALVRRRSDPDDLRGVVAEQTPEGLQLLKACGLQ